MEAKRDTWKNLLRFTLGVCFFVVSINSELGGCLGALGMLGGAALIGSAVPRRFSTNLMSIGFLWISCIEAHKLATLDDPSLWSWFGAIFFGLLFLLSAVIFVLNRVVPDEVLERWGGDSAE